MQANAQDPQARPISQAILKRDLSAVQRLVEGGEDVNQRLFNNETPAIMAAASQNWVIVLYLLQAGADPTLQKRNGVSLVKIAASSRVLPDSREGQALAEVKKMLAERGLL
jgi:ankyrin repeat protein